MKRRDFIAAIGGAAMLRSVPARAAGPRPRVGILTLLTHRRTNDFVAGLRDLGYIDGQTIDIDYRFADGDVARLQPLARELMAMHPDVVFAREPAAARAMKAVAPDLPIVSAVLQDHMPDLYASFAYPGGTVTGIANVVEGMNAKVVELAGDFLPHMSRLGYLNNPATANDKIIVAQVEAGARARGVALLVEDATTRDEIAPALDRLAKNGAQAAAVIANGMFFNNAGVIAEHALAVRLPTIFQARLGPDAGGFMSYGTNTDETDRRAAVFVDKILKGAKPSELPIEVPTRFELVVNLKTAKALGLEISREMLLRADEVIE
ncbi:MAG TPA: ABC transporter substrate-binding protein [Stellaceae bacterium]|nr:ABC transporter substrate-binding protein [Stellaceae bacterium]